MVLYFPPLLKGAYAQLPCLPLIKGPLDFSLRSAHRPFRAPFDKASLRLKLSSESLTGFPNFLKMRGPLPLRPHSFSFLFLLSRELLKRYFLALRRLEPRAGKLRPLSTRWARVSVWLTKRRPQESLRNSFPLRGYR